VMLAEPLQHVPIGMAVAVIRPYRDDGERRIRGNSGKNAFCPRGCEGRWSFVR
jgi:hypothetical protein